MRDWADGGQRDAFARAIRAARLPAPGTDVSVAEARDAVARARAAFPGWAAAEPARRAAVLTSAADLHECRS